MSEKPEKMLRPSPRNQNNKQTTPFTPSSATDYFETGLVGTPTTAPVTTTPTSSSSMKRPNRSPPSSGNNYKTSIFRKTISTSPSSPKSPTQQSSATYRTCVRCVRVGFLVLVMIYVTSMNHRYDPWNMQGSSSTIPDEDDNRAIDKMENRNNKISDNWSDRVDSHQSSPQELHLKSGKNSTLSFSPQQQQQKQQQQQQQQQYQKMQENILPHKDNDNSKDDNGNNININNIQNNEKDNHDILESYNPLHASIIPPGNDHPVPVWLFVGGEVDKQTGRPQFQTQSITLFDGLKRSKFLDLKQVKFMTQHKVDPIHPSHMIPIPTPNEEPHVVWMVDMASLHQDCHPLERILQFAKFESDNKPSPNWTLVLVDYTSTSSVVDCPRLLSQIPQTHIRYIQRTVVQGRYWDSSLQWIQPGTIVSPNKGLDISGGPIVQVPLGVRESFVASIRNQTVGMSPNKKMKNPASSSSKIKRTTDVSMFVKEGDYTHYAFLRRRVGQLLAALEGTKTTNGRKIHTSIDYIRGDSWEDDTSHDDPHKVSSLYVQQMLRSKIVVVAQRDEWEDTYQLMEAMASGALVLADTMLALPKGLQNNTNLVLYDSAESLQKLVIHYLDPKQDEERIRMARAGFKLVMGQHRSWHQVETLLFGKPLTLVDQPYVPAPPLQQGTGDVLDEQETNNTIETTMSTTTTTTQTTVADTRRRKKKKY